MTALFESTVSLEKAGYSGPSVIDPHVRGIFSWGKDWRTQRDIPPRRGLVWDFYNCPRSRGLRQTNHISIFKPLVGKDMLAS